MYALCSIATRSNIAVDLSLLRACPQAREIGEILPDAPSPEACFAVTHIYSVRRVAHCGQIREKGELPSHR